LGASGWDYFVPYEEDVQLALNKLRDAIFQSGKYPVREAFDAGTRTFDDFLPPNATDEDREALWAQFQVWQREVQPEVFHSIEEVLAWNGEEGTGTILDVYRISTTPLPATKVDFIGYDFHNPIDMERFMAAMQERLGMVYPLSNNQLLAFFGTVQPTHEMIEQVLNGPHELYNLMKRDTGVYIIVYQSDNPSEIYFTGFSGD
jgi:hypothetical protein